MTQPACPPFATMNGRIVPFEKATISIMAPGLTFSVLAFEGLRGYWNGAHEQLYVFRAPEHMARLAFSSRVIEIDGIPDGQALTAQMTELARACEMRKKTATFGFRRT